MKRVVVGLGLLGLALAGALHYLVRMERHAGFTEPVFVDIERGTPMAEIGRRLERAGVVRHWALYVLARLPNPGLYPQAGEYRFAEAATAHEVYLRLARGDVYLVELVVPEGADAFDVAAAAAKAGLGHERELLRRALAEEGYLFPAKYRFRRNAGAPEVIGAMKRQFERVWGEMGGRGDRRAVVTLASLVEKEAVLAEERRRIAGVFVNRLRTGMRLQCDPTVAYAARLAGQWRGTIYRSDLERVHPYNTYTAAGLPPGPIANPGRAALEAALDPLESEELYFVAAPDGSGAHIFSKDYAAHQRAVARFRRGQRAESEGKSTGAGGGAGAGSR